MDRHDYRWADSVRSFESYYSKKAGFDYPATARCLDLLSISVQAGLSFDGALKKVVERMEGPLIDEFRWMLRDIRMGMTRARSMKFMAERCDIQDIYLLSCQ